MQDIQRNEYIIVDIETTGLDLKNSSIIEVGALLIKDSAVRDRFSSLIKYNGKLSETIKRVTGINEQMLENAPELDRVISDLKGFINKRPVVAHNGFHFDFPMLERHGLKIAEKYDSMEFAFFVLPTSKDGHSMPALAQHFNIGDVPHRALGDCEIEFEVIRKLQHEYQKRNKIKREALNYLANAMDWWWANFIPGEAKKRDISSLVEKYEPYRKPSASQEILEFNTKGIDIDEMNKYFTPASLPKTSDNESDYSEDRPEQRNMATMVADAFKNHKHVVIEAGTGTGKSKAYLVPSLLFALRNGIPVIISTFTKALQDQLSIKEIPHIREIINPDLRVAVLKGKKNYVCLHKFEEFSEEIESTFSQRSLYEFGESGTGFSTRLAYLLISSWIIETGRGDWDELPYWFTERIAKRIEQDICNFDELCGNGTCESYEKQKCFLAKARLRAKDADIVVVNHALALAGITIDEAEDEIDPDNGGEASKVYGHTVFPGEAKFIVFDEAHHLEDAATSAWERIISNDVFQYLFQQLYGKSSVGSSLKFAAKENEELIPLLNDFEKKEESIRSNVDNLFGLILTQAVPEDNKDGFSTNLMFDEMADSYREATVTCLQNIRFNLKDVARIIERFLEETDSPRNKKILSVRIKTISGLIESIDIFLAEGKEYVKYFERFAKNVEIKAAPLSVAKHLKEYVYDNFSSVVLTSATLAVNKTFSYFAHRCGTSLVDRSKINYYLLKSCFDYEKQVKFFVPKGIAYAGNKDTHLEKSAEFLEKAILASGGGSLVLCTSHKQVEALYNLLMDSLSKNNIWLLRQSRGSSIGSVIRDFKKDTNSVLIGTESLWQGIDIPGDSLRSLFIYKIPYRMPFLPLIKARKREIEDNGGDPYADYYEPLAALILKQGFGRLIRKSSDSGIAVLLDESLLDKPRLLNSLPDGVSPKKVEQEVIFKELENSQKTIIESEDPRIQPKVLEKVIEKKFNCQTCGRPIKHKGNCLRCNILNKKNKSSTESKV